MVSNTMEGLTLPAMPKAERRGSAKGEAAPLLTDGVDNKHRRLDDDSAGKPLIRTDSPSSPTFGASGGGDAQAVFNMVNAILGAGVLGYPFCFRSCGVGLATVLVLACWGASHFSMRLLLLSANLVGARTYEELARTLLGRIGSQVLVACIVALNLGCLVAYVNILADVLSSVAGSIIPPGAEPSRNALLTGITVFGVWPVALIVRSPDVLARVSQASVAFVFAFAAVVVYHALGPDRPRSSPTAGLEMWRWEGLLVAFPVIAYGFTAHQFLFGIYVSLKAPSVRRMSGIVQKALMLCTSVYVVVGIGGYAAFRSRTSGDILRNFGAAAASRLVKVGYGLAILGTVPLVVMPFHDSMLPLVACLAAPGSPAGTPATPLQQQAITSLALGASLAAAVLLPNVEFIFGLSGSTAAALLAFIFPAWTFLLAATPARTAARPDLDLTPWQWVGIRQRAWMLLAVGIVVGVACTRATVLAVHQENEVVQLAQEMAASVSQVEQATTRHAAAVQVAETVETVSSAAAQVGGAQLHATATRASAAQAQAALESLDTSRAGQETLVEQQAEEAGVELLASSSRQKGGEAGHAGHVESFALGAVMANLRDMKSRVNSTLGTFESVTAALNVTSARLREEHRKMEESRRKHNDTAGAAAAALPPAASQSMGAMAPSAEARAAQKGERGEHGKAWQQVQKEAEALAQVQRRANETLAAIKATSAALTAAETAVDAVERAKGRPDDPATRQAVKVMLTAVTATGEAANKVDATLAELQQLQEEQAAQLQRLQRSGAEASAAGAAKDQPRKALPSHTEVVASATQAATQATAELLDAGVVNVSRAAQAAVAAANSELGVALAGANVTLTRSQQQDPEVAKRAEEIAVELGRVAKEAELASDAADISLPEQDVALFGESLIPPITNATATSNSTAAMAALNRR